MLFDEKVQCMSCFRFYYIRGKKSLNIIPDTAGPGDVFKAKCPICNEWQARIPLKAEKGFYRD